MNREECNDMIMQAYFDSLVSIGVETDRLKSIYEVQREEIAQEESND